MGRHEPNWSHLGLGTCGWYFLHVQFLAKSKPLVSVYTWPGKGLVCLPPLPRWVNVMNTHSHRGTLHPHKLKDNLVSLCQEPGCRVGTSSVQIWIMHIPCPHSIYNSLKKKSDKEVAIDNLMRKNKSKMFIKSIFIILMVRRYVHVWRHRTVLGTYTEISLRNYHSFGHSHE